MSWQLALAWGIVVVVLFFAAGRTQVRALAGFVPDCVVLVGRLLRDPRVPRRRKLLLALTAGYLALPFDLVPDFIPLIGQLDDAIILAFVLRHLLRGNERAIRELWPGPEQSLDLLLRLIGRLELPNAPEA
jgi:uncharacterized membrane protein YkvA (DUF1232 family)